MFPVAFHGTSRATSDGYLNRSVKWLMRVAKGAFPEIFRRASRHSPAATRGGAAKTHKRLTGNWGSFLTIR